MGLSISYSWTLPPSRASEIPKLLAHIAEVARQLGFVSVEGPLHLTGDACVPDPSKQDQTRLWLLIQSQIRVCEPGEPSWCWKETVPPKELYVLNTLPGKGCETACFGFRRSEAGSWDWESFCKTQYAANEEVGGLDNFFQSHVALCDLLRSIRDMGIALVVSDEGEYWETRNLEVLRTNISVAKLFG